MNEKQSIACRAAALLQPGWIVNLGIGIPTLVTQFVDPAAVCFQTENGLLGVGSPPAQERIDPNLVDAGKRPVTERPGAAFFDSATSFAMIRGGTWMPWSWAPCRWTSGGEWRTGRSRGSPSSAWAGRWT